MKIAFAKRHLYMRFASFMYNYYRMLAGSKRKQNNVEAERQPKRICTIKTLYYFLRHVKIYVDWSIQNGIFIRSETENCKIPAIKIDVHVHQGNSRDFVFFFNVSHCTVLFNFVNSNCDANGEH